MKIKQKIKEIWKKSTNPSVLLLLSNFWKKFNIIFVFLVIALIAVLFYSIPINPQFNEFLFILILLSSFLLQLFNIILSEQKIRNFIVTFILGFLFAGLSYYFHKEEEKKEDLKKLREIVKDDLIPKFEQIHFLIHMRHHIYEETRDSMPAKVELAKIINYAYFFRKESIPKLETAKIVLEKTLNQFPEIKSTLYNYSNLLNKVIPQNLNQFKFMILMNNPGDNTYGESKEFEQLDSLDSHLLKLIESKVE